MIRPHKIDSMFYLSSRVEFGPNSTIKYHLSNRVIKIKFLDGLPTDYIVMKGGLYGGSQIPDEISWQSEHNCLIPHQLLVTPLTLVIINDR